MTKFKVCCITNNPEQFQTEMEAVFGPSKVLLWEAAKRESATMVHLGFTLSGSYNVQQIKEEIPGYCSRYFNFNVYLL